MAMPSGCSSLPIRQSSGRCSWIAPSTEPVPQPISSRLREAGKCSSSSRRISRPRFKNQKLAASIRRRSWKKPGSKPLRLPISSGARQGTPQRCSTARPQLIHRQSTGQGLSFWNTATASQLGHIHIGVQALPADHIRLLHAHPASGVFELNVVEKLVNWVRIIAPRPLLLLNELAQDATSEII